MRRRYLRPQRDPIYIGCEGQSEMEYAGWLRALCHAHPVHLFLDNLGKGAGDPLTRIELAYDRLGRAERDREPFVGRFLFLDTDQLTGDAERTQRARRRAEECGFTVIWQQPNHEAFLLRHLPGCLTLRPPDKRSADGALAREWAAYRKPCPREQLERRLDLAGARAVAGTMGELADLLSLIKLMDP